MPKRSFKKLSLTTRSLIVALISVIFAFLTCLVMSAVAFFCEDPTKNLLLYGEVCFLASMLFCGFVGAKASSERRFASGVAASGTVLLFVIAASIALGTDAFIKEVTMAALGILTGACGAAMGAREPKRKHRR